jgi:hypothetical protein
MTDEEVFSLLIAAIIHDFRVRHPLTAELLAALQAVQNAEYIVDACTDNPGQQCIVRSAFNP